MRSALLCASSAEQLFITLQFWKICGFSGIAFSREGTQREAVAAALVSCGNSRAAGTPSVCSLRSQPAPPRGRLCAMPETLPPPPKAVPLRDDFPRSGGRCRIATKGGVWLDAKRQDGRGNSRALLQASNAKAARPGGLAAFMLIKIFYSTSSSAKIHSTSLMWEPLRE